MKENVIKKIIENNITISFAESMTGGSLASAFTKIPGASSVFLGSFVTYSDEYKVKYLGVKKKTIKINGVVSEAVAKEMAAGLYKNTKVDIAVSVTGNAGPTQGDPNEPVGRCYVGIKYLKDIYVYELNLSGSREDIINATVEFVFIKLDELIENKK